VGVGVDRDPLPQGRFLDTVSPGHDDAAELMAGHERVGRQRRLPIDEMKICSTDPASTYLDYYLISTGPRVLELSELEDARFNDGQCAHSPDSFLLAGRHERSL
jgi:hypothetical protein